MQGLLRSPACAGHALCRERAALQHLTPFACAGSGRSPTLGGCTHLFIFALQDRRVTPYAELLGISQLGRKPACRFCGGDSRLVGRRRQRVCGWEGVFPNTASATTSFVLQSGCFCNREKYHHGFPPPPSKKSTRQPRKEVASTVTTDDTRSGTHPTNSLSKCSANPTREHCQHLRDAQPPLREGLLLRPC